MKKECAEGKLIKGHQREMDEGREGKNERVPPVCPMPFPLRLSLLSDLRAIVPHGCMEGAGAPCT